MGKYLVDDNSSVTVDIFIDVSNGVRVLNETCTLQQGKNPCDGDIIAPCQQKYEKCNCSLREICGDKLGEIKDKNNGELPTTVVKESATWKKENWSLSSLIESESWITNLKTKEKEVDTIKMINAKFKYQLKNWTLDKDSPSLKLNFSRDANGIEFLRHETMTEIGKIDREVVLSLYRKGMDKLSNPGEPIKNS